MADTLQGWADRAGQVPAVIVRATPGAVQAGAQVLEQQARANLLSASGGDLNLSRVRSGKGAHVDVQVRTRGAGQDATAMVLPVGPVSLLEKDTRGHRQPFQYVAARTGGKRDYSMNRRRKAVRAPFQYVPGLGIFQHIKHPGTRGKRPVGRAFDQAADQAGQAGAQAFADAVTRHMSS